MPWAQLRLICIVVQTESELRRNGQQCSVLLPNYPPSFAVCESPQEPSDESLLSSTAPLTDPACPSQHARHPPNLFLDYTTKKKLDLIQDVVPRDRAVQPSPNLQLPSSLPVPDLHVPDNSWQSLNNCVYTVSWIYNFVDLQFCGYTVLWKAL
jgi:hypothetical protein